MEENKIVEFIKSWQGYAVGEIAGFPTTFANKVIENGFAKAYKDETVLEEFFKKVTPVSQLTAEEVKNIVKEEFNNETKEVAERPKPKAKEKGPKS